jgi:hypothetical protein
MEPEYEYLNVLKKKLAKKLSNAEESSICRNIYDDIINREGTATHLVLQARYQAFPL